MKNEFFGDVRDYRKYGLLRILSGGKSASSAICWMLTENEDRPSKTTYLCRDKTWRYKTCWHFDERLFDGLHQAVCVDGERNVVRAETMDILDPAVFFFYKKLLKDNANERKEYFEEFLTRCEGKVLVFLDPDNGLEIKSVPVGRKGSSKFLYFDELSRAFKKQHSILVFQFFTRKAPEDVIKEKTDQLFSRLGVEEIASFKTPSVIFFLIPQPEHLNEMKECSERVREVWGEQIQPRWHSRTRDGHATKEAI